MPNAVNPTTPPKLLNNGHKAAISRRINKAKRELHERADAAYSGPRDMDLIGLDVDGRMSLWDVGKVKPVKRFDYFMDTGVRRIHAGHYVIDWKGYAITVHCGNNIDGTVSVLFMCSSGDSISMPRKEVQELLLGKVITDPEISARIMDLLKEWGEDIEHRQKAPHLQRGYLGGPKS